MRNLTSKSVDLISTVNGFLRKIKNPGAFSFIKSFGGLADDVNACYRYPIPYGTLR